MFTDCRLGQSGWVILTDVFTHALHKNLNKSNFHKLICNKNKYMRKRYQKCFLRALSSLL